MKLYNFTQAQEQQLALRLQGIGKELLATRFDDPANDDKMIRWHACQTGKFLLLQELLEDNFPEPDYAQEAQPATQL